MRKILCLALLVLIVPPVAVLSQQPKRIARSATGSAVPQRAASTSGRQQQARSASTSARLRSSIPARSSAYNPALSARDSEEYRLKLDETEIENLKEKIEARSDELDELEEELETLKNDLVEAKAFACEMNNGYITQVGSNSTCKKCKSDEMPNRAGTACVLSTRTISDRQSECRATNGYIVPGTITMEDPLGQCIICGSKKAPTNRDTNVWRCEETEEYLDQLAQAQDECFEKNGYLTATNTCRKCSASQSPNQDERKCEDDPNKQAEVGKAACIASSANTWWDPSGAVVVANKCKECTGTTKPNALRTACVDDQAALAAQSATNEAKWKQMFDEAVAPINGRQAKSNSTITLPPGKYTYELSGAGGGGGGGGSSKSGCTSKADGGDGGNGELKSGGFTLNTEKSVTIVIGGNVSGAGDCGYGGSDNGAAGEASSITVSGSAAIVAAGGGGGKWTDSRRKASPSGSGAAGGEGGGKGRPDPRNGAPGWIKLTRSPL